MNHSEWEKFKERCFGIFVTLLGLALIMTGVVMVVTVLLGVFNKAQADTNAWGEQEQCMKVNVGYPVVQLTGNFVNQVGQVCSPRQNRNQGCYLRNYTAYYYDSHGRRQTAIVKHRVTTVYRTETQCFVR